MSKKDEFKLFLQSRPELVEYIKNKEMTIQSFYELYDIYGSDEKAWSPYLKKVNNNVKLSDIINNINIDDVQKHVNNAQKALGVLGEFTSKDKGITNIIKGPLLERPINKFFED